jgi:hypothetical protein
MQVEKEAIAGAQRSFKRELSFRFDCLMMFDAYMFLFKLCIRELRELIVGWQLDFLNRKSN